MVDAKLSNRLKEALLALLDDANPVVRASLLEKFEALDKEGIAFLKEVSNSGNRILGWHAHWFLRELKSNDPVGEFREFIRSLNYELETGSLLMHRTVDPDMDVTACCLLLDEIAQRCRELMTPPMSAREKCRVFNRMLFHEYGFRGDIEDYCNPRNSFVGEVLARRRGLPITLCILYILVAQRCGFTLEPVAIPGYFLVGCFTEAVPFFIDPFERGVFRSPEDVFDFLKDNHIVPKLSHLAPAPIREVLCRSCRNLVQHYTALQDLPKANLFASFVHEFESTYQRHANP